jgi:uncharacterized GH25 family protein
MRMSAYYRSGTLACVLLLALVLTPLVFGHYTWLVRTHYSSSGDIAYLELGHGHEFPHSEEAMSAESLKVFVSGANGNAKALTPQRDGNVLKIEAPMAGRDLQRVYYVRDRGIMSQTADGWKQGGKDKFPQAKTSRRIVQYGITWVGFTGTTTSARPLGLDLEMNYETGMRGRLVRVMRNGKPARDIEVRAVFSEEDERSLGKTDRQGYVSADTLPKNRAILFSASVEEPAPKNSNFNINALSCALSIPAE